MEIQPSHSANLKLFRQWLDELLPQTPVTVVEESRGLCVAFMGFGRMALEGKCNKQLVVFIGI